MNKKTNEIRREHLKNLIRHSSEATLIIPNSLTNNTPCCENIKKIREEITEALEFLNQEKNITIITTPYKEEYTKLHLIAGDKAR